MLRTPKLVVLNLTTDCNMRCKYCYASAGDKQTYMSEETALRVVKELKRINGNGRIKILFHGGEPLLCYDLIQAVIKYCNENYKKEDIEYYIQTNCVLLDEEKIKYFKENDVRISISIDGNDGCSNDCRILPDGKNSIICIKESIDLLNKNNLEINALAVLNKNNYKHLDEIIDYFVENNIKAFSFNYFIKGGRGNSNADLALDNDELFEATKKIIDKIEEYYKKGILINEKNVYFLIKSIMTNSKRYMCANSPCGAGLNIFGITPDGSIYPCDDLSSQPQFCLGNINEQDLNDIMEANIIHYFARCNYEAITECKDCNLKNLCGAGCCSRKFYENGDIYSKDPICTFYKKVIPYVQNLLLNNNITKEIYK